MLHGAKCRRVVPVPQHRCEVLLHAELKMVKEMIYFTRFFADRDKSGGSALPSGLPWSVPAAHDVPDVGRETQSLYLFLFSVFANEGGIKLRTLRQK